MDEAVLLVQRLLKLRPNSRAFQNFAEELEQQASGPAKSQANSNAN
jgi:hypothetical protein